MTSAGGQPPGAGSYSGPGGSPTAPAHAAPSGGGNNLAAEVHTLERAIFEVKRIIVGQDQLVERMLVGLLSKGHVLLEGVPGVAKTLAVETFAKVVGGTFARIQFTPDLAGLICSVAKRGVDGIPAAWNSWTRARRCPTTFVVMAVVSD